MFCKQCGTRLPDDSAFCPKCGEKVMVVEEPEPTSEPTTAEETEPLEAIAGKAAPGVVVAATAAERAGERDESEAEEAEQAASQSVADDPKAGQNAADDPGATVELPVVQEGAAEPAPKKPKRTAAIAAVVAVVVVAAVGIGAGLWWKADQDAKAAEEAAAQAAWELAHTTRITKVSVDAPGFDDASTPIPVKVTGVDLDGNAVDEVQFLKPDSMQVETLAGSYDVSFPAGYITGEGKVYKSPGATQHVEVAQPTEADAQAQPQSGQGGGTASAAPASSSAPQQEAQPQSSGSSQASAQSEGGGQPSGEAQPSSESQPSGEAQPSSEAQPSGEAQPSDESNPSGEAQPSGESQPSDGAKAAEQVVQAGAYEEVDDLEVTDELVNEITDLAKQDPEDNGKAEKLQKAASDNHQAAVKAEEERIAAEKEAERKAAREAEMTNRASGFLNVYYDKYGDGNVAPYCDPNDPPTKPMTLGLADFISRIDSVYVIDENTVGYVVTMIPDPKIPGNQGSTFERSETKTLRMTPEGYVDWRSL